MTALYVAIKINKPVATGTAVFVVMSDGTYSLQEIQDVELLI